MSSRINGLHHTCAVTAHGRQSTILNEASRTCILLHRCAITAHRRRRMPLRRTCKVRIWRTGTQYQSMEGIPQPCKKRAGQLFCSANVRQPRKGSNESPRASPPPRGSGEVCAKTVPSYRTMGASSSVPSLASSRMLTADGAVVVLGSLYEKEAVLLIWLRHLG